MVIPTITMQQFEVIDDFMAKNEKIKAIKELRTATAIPGVISSGLGLKEAKDIADEWAVTRGQLLEKIKRRAGVGKLRYVGSRENNLLTITEIAKLDFDEESMILLVADLDKCSDDLIRWLAFRFSLREQCK